MIAHLFNTQMVRIYSILLVFVAVCCLLAACEDKTNPNGNKVTVNPPAGAQQKETVIPSGLDKSPMDMTYYPENYPIMKMQHKDVEPLTARLIYSRPQKNGRIIFGSLVEYGKSWRLGANEASEIEFFKDVTIQQKKIPRGRYVLYCIPYSDKWIIKFNSDVNTWGLQIDSTKDVFQFEIPVAKTNYPYEFFTMEFETAEPGLQLAMMWDSVRAVLPIRN
jgi:hypothetical protein